MLYGDFTLASGRKSRYYFDSKLLTLHPDGAEFVASQLVNKLHEEGIEYVGGTAYGAIPIVSLIALYSKLSGGPPIKAFYHRKQSDIKGHGPQTEVDGQTPPKGTRVAILEDVVTTGDSLLLAIERAKQMGCNVTDAIVLVDRNEGGRQVIENLGYRFWALFTVESHPDSGVELEFVGERDETKHHRALRERAGRG